MAAALAPKIGDLIHQTSTTTGTSDFTLVSVNGHRDFSTDFGTGATTDVFYYFIQNRDAAEWERGKGHLSASNTLVRDTVITSSNANAAVNFSAGTKDVICDVPADRCAVFEEVSLASSGTTDLGTYPSICVTITGTTTITSFGSTAKQGTLRFIKFSGALTLTHNATSLIIPGGANILTANGDCATVRHEGSGNWRVLVYQKADGTAVVATTVPSAASQAQMEAASATNVYGTPGRQHFHPAHLKAFAIWYFDKTALSGNMTTADTGTDIIQWSTNHGLSSGDCIFSTGGTWPSGYTATSAVFVNVTDATHFSLHTNYADAIAGTNKINLSSTGSGTRTASKITVTITTSFGLADSAPIIVPANLTFESWTLTLANALSNVNAGFWRVTGIDQTTGAPFLPTTTTTLTTTALGLSWGAGTTGASGLWMAELYGDMA